MRDARRLTTALAVAVVALWAASCGDDGSSGGGTTAGQQGAGAAQTEPAERQGGKNGSSGGEGSGGAGGEKAAEEFVPQEHDDSGGGSAQFRVKGGDNSVQEFGAEGSETEFEQAAAVLHGFLDARAQGAWAAACKYLARDVAESLQNLVPPSARAESPSCAELLAMLANPAAEEELRREAREADIGSLRVEGERGFLIYRSYDGTITAVLMSREGGGWKVASLGGVPLS